MNRRNVIAPDKRASYDTRTLPHSQFYTDTALQFHHCECLHLTLRLCVSFAVSYTHLDVYKRQAQH